MPIKPENKVLYPRNWATEIRPAILLRANNCCERCYAPNRTRIARFQFEGMHGWAYHDGEGLVGRNSDTGEFIPEMESSVLDQVRVVEIVLTIAHTIDPNPGNCDPSNLEALCQRCHNILDLPMRMANAAVTRRRRAPTVDMFDSGRAA